jgi:hypothetical protein
MTSVASGLMEAGYSGHAPGRPSITQVLERSLPHIFISLGWFFCYTLKSDANPAVGVLAELGDPNLFTGNGLESQASPDFVEQYWQIPP